MRRCSFAALSRRLHNRLDVVLHLFSQDDWDDEDVSDDFTNQLRAELDKAAQPAPMAQ